MTVNDILDKCQPIPFSGCWLWLGATSNERAQIWYDGGSKRVARVVYELLNGPIPDGLSICHTCDVKLCVSPYHLYAGTAKDNRADLFSRGDPEKVYNQKSYNASLTHCKRGHSLENAYINPTTGSRQCRECRKAR